MSELVVIESKNIIEVFSNNGLKPILDKIEKEAKAFVGDISTDKGRKEIASMAYKVAKSKTYLDDLGKNLTDEWRKSTDKVNAERKTMRERLDALKDEVRKPLTDWENAEKKRLESHEAKIKELQSLANLPLSATVAEIEANVQKVNDMADYKWEEFIQRAITARENVLATLNTQLDTRRQRDAEVAELKRLQEAEVERQRIAHEEKLKTDAAEKARKEAEARAAAERKALEEEQRIENEKAEAERKAIEQARIDAERRAERAEQEKKEAAEKAEIDRKREEQIKIEAQERAERLEREAKQAEEKAASEKKAAEEREAKLKAEREEAERKLRAANVFKAKSEMFDEVFAILCQCNEALGNSHPKKDILAQSHAKIVRDAAEIISKIYALENTKAAA